MGFIRSDIVYLLIDLLVICLLFLALFVRRKGLIVAGLFAAIAIIFKLVVFVGLRPFDAGNDTIGYYYTFKLLQGVATARNVGGTYGGTEQSGELLYWPFAAFLKPLLDGSFRLFLIVSILISAYLTYIGNKKFVGFDKSLGWKDRVSISIIITYLVFLSFEIAYFGGHIRSALGIPFALISYYFASKKKLVATAFTFFLALGFHNSAISVLPLLVMEIFMPQVRQSKNITMFIILLLVAAFLFGKLGGVGSVIGFFSDYYHERYVAYVEYGAFNIQSIFGTAYFWIILIFIFFFLSVGYRKAHFYVFYYFGMVLLFSETPKISERFFAYILIFIPFLLYYSLRIRFDRDKSILLTVLFFYAVSPLVVTSYAVTGTLSIYSYILGR